VAAQSDVRGLRHGLAPADTHSTCRGGNRQDEQQSADDDGLEREPDDRLLHLSAAPRCRANAERLPRFPRLPPRALS